MLTSAARVVNLRWMGRTGRAHQLAGKTFERLTVLFRVGTNGKGHVLWMCKCACGARKLIQGRHLVREKKQATKSCGCLGKSVSAGMLFKHGYSIPRTNPDPLYSRWCNLRCQERKLVCARWQDFGSFLEDLLALEPGWQPGFWLMRKDQSKPWCKENCIWANAKRRRALRQSYRDARGGNWKNPNHTTRQRDLKISRSANGNRSSSETFSSPCLSRESGSLVPSRGT